MGVNIYIFLGGAPPWAFQRGCYNALARTLVHHKLMKKNEKDLCPHHQNEHTKECAGEDMSCIAIYESLIFK
jgi:hypothetical protein